MSLPTSPNKTTPTVLEKGDQGWPVYGLQTGLDNIGHSLAFDGDFGPATHDAVIAFQKNNFLTPDGIAGQNTQARLISLIDTKTHNRHDKLPDGLLRGFANAESGNKVGAVNWDIGGGVDCGVVQLRCYGPPYVMDVLRSAYNPAVSLERIAVTFQGRLVSLRAMPYAKSHKLEYAQRYAALSWNWPYAAEQYAMRGKLPNPDRDATWAVYIEKGVKKRVKFPDGEPVMTYKDWAEFYALGGEHGEGSVTRFVRW